MDITREEAHKIVDFVYDAKEGKGVKLQDLVSSGSAPQDQPEPEKKPEEKPKRELPKDKRVVRTKTTGDRVFLLDEIKKTRHWVTNPKALESLGFSLSDVAEIEDSGLLKYQMGAAIQKVD